MEWVYIIYGLIAAIGVIVFISLILICVLRKKKAEKFECGFLKTNLQFLKIKLNKDSKIIDTEMTIDFVELEKSIKLDQGITNDELNTLAEYFQIDKMILIYHDLREEYDEKWKSM